VRDLEGTYTDEGNDLLVGYTFVSINVPCFCNIELVFIFPAGKLDFKTVLRVPEISSSLTAAGRLCGLPESQTKNPTRYHQNRQLELAKS